MMWRELYLERAPGVTPGLGVRECGPGLNVVVGPNAIGKSTLSRAARAALWDAEDFERRALRGRLVRRGEEWDVEREGDRPARWHGGGTARPALPDARFRGCFHLSLEELLRVGDTDENIAREVKLEMSGRYDLDAVCADARAFQARSRTVSTARERLARAAARVDEVEREARALMEREARLDPLRRERANLLRAVDDRNALEALRDAAAYEAELARLDASLAEDDPLLAKLRDADDFDRLEGQGAELADAERELEAARAALSEAEVALARLALPNDGVGDERLELGARHVRALERLAEERRELQPRLDALAGTAAAARAGTEEWTEDALRDAERLLEERAAADAEADALRSLLEGLGRADADDAGAERVDGDHGDAARALAALVDWCAAPASDGGSARGLLGSLLAAALLLACFAVAALLGAALPALAWLAPLAPIVVAWLLARRAGDKSDSPDRDAARRRYADSGAPEPSAWDAAGVRERLDALVEREAENRARRARTSWLDVRRNDLERIERRRAELDERANALREQLGVSGASALEARHVLDALRRDAERRGLEARADALDARLAASTEELEDVLEAAGVGRAGDRERALARWGDLERRAREHPSALAAKRAATSRRDDARRRLDRARAQRDEWLERRGVAEADVDRVLALRGAFADHLRRRTRAESLRGAVAERRARWAGRDDLLDLGCDEIEERIREAGEGAERARELDAKIASIEAELAQLEKDTRLPERETEREAAEEALDDLRDDALAGTALRELLGEVEARHRREGRPEVLRRADRHLAMFTRDAYRLDDAGDDALQVVEIGSRRRLGPGELSAGTRAQLLLAVRLAYAESIEGDDPLPLFLDEALLGADPERFAAIAHSLGTLIEEGRQVFYLTAEPREEFELRTALGALGESLVVHDLGARRDALIAAAGESLEVVPLAPVPAPEGRDFEDYARALGNVHAVDGFASADELHVLRLWADLPETAYRVLCERRETVGAARSFLEHTKDPPWDAKDRARFQARCCVAERTLELWRVGRAPRLDAETLRESPMGRSSKIEDIVALAERLCWDGDALICALESKEIKNVRGEMVAELREFLLAEGLLSTNAPLDFDALLARVLDDVQPLINDGALTREEAEQLAHRLYRWLEPSAVDVTREGEGESPSETAAAV